MMKRFLSILAVLVLLSLCACQGGALTSRMEASVKAADKPAAAASDAEAAPATDAPDAKASDAEAALTTDAPDAEATPAPTEATEPAGEPVIEEQLLFDTDGVRVTATGYTVDEYYGPSVSLLIENDSGRNILITSDYVSVNGWGVDSMFISSVDSGKKARETLSFLQGDLDAAGIRDIGEIKCAFSVSDDDSYDQLFVTELISIRTSLYGSTSDHSNLSGDSVYDADGVKIVILGLYEHEYKGLHLRLYIKNDSGRSLRITVGSLSVDGFMADSSLYMLLPSGEQAIGAVCFLDDEYRNMPADDVSEIELDFRLYDPDTYDTILSIPPHVYKVK